MRMKGIGGRVADPRAALHPIAEMDETDVRAMLEQADAVIGATGYQPHAFPLFDIRGERIELRSETGGRLVDEQCRMMRSDGQAVPGAFAIGLAAGFVPSGPLGGEPSFRGQANGLWLWQNDIGWMIARQVLESARKEAAA